MNRQRFVSTWLLSIIAFVALGGGDSHAGKKVTLCHFPPDNPGNPKTISVGESAIGAHMAHGDQLGECPTGCQLDESACDDDNACTIDSCGAGGACVYESANCDDGDPCTIDVCSAATGCEASPNDGAACDDGNACTDEDACTDGECQGNPIPSCCATIADCDDGDLCTDDDCVARSCTNEPRDCGVADACSVGFCDLDGECGIAPVDCSDGNDCTRDFCDPDRGCFSQRKVETTQECQDGVDNDCDGLVDYAEREDCAADLFIRLSPSVTSSFAPSRLTLTISVGNLGRADADAPNTVTAEAVLPEGVELLQLLSPDCAYAAAMRTVSCSTQTLEVLEAESWSAFEAAIADPGTYTITGVTLSDLAADVDPQNNSESVTVRILAPPD